MSVGVHISTVGHIPVTEIRLHISFDRRVAYGGGQYGRNRLSRIEICQIICRISCEWHRSRVFSFEQNGAFQRLFIAGNAEQPDGSRPFSCIVPFFELARVIRSKTAHKFYKLFQKSNPDFFNWGDISSVLGDDFLNDIPDNWFAKWLVSCLLEW